MAEPILKASRWQRRNVSFYGTKIQLEMRALTKREAPAFAKEVQRLFDAMKKNDEGKFDEAAVDRRIAEWNDGTFVTDLFTKYIRLPEGSAVELDDERLETAMQVHEAGDADFLMECVLVFQIGTRVSPAEAFPSGSPSNSESGAGLDGPATDAPATVGEDSPAP